jgi:PAS domain S-box-containing protein
MNYAVNFVNIIAGIANSMADGIILVNQDGKILFANNSFSALSGFDVKALKNENISKLFTSTAFAKPELLFQMNNYLLHDVEIRRKNKTTITGRAAIFKLTDVEKDSFGFAVIFPSKTAESEKIRSQLKENIFLKIINYRTDAIWFSGDIVNRQTLFITDSVQSICGWTPEEFYAGGWIFFVSLVHPDDIFTLIESHTKWLIQKNKVGPMIDHIPYHNFLRYRSRNGNYIRMDVEYNVQYRDGDLVKLIFGSFRPLPENTSLTRDYIRQIDGKTFIDLNFLKTVQQSPSSNTNLPALTPRENQVLELLSDGCSSEEIANSMHVSIHTINTYRKQIMKKFNAKNLAELVKKYVSGR